MRAAADDANEAGEFGSSGYFAKKLFYLLLRAEEKSRDRACSIAAEHTFLCRRGGNYP